MSQKQIFFGWEICSKKRKNSKGEVMIAEVIIQSNVKNLNKIFDYKVPANLEGREFELIGARVLIPFGRMKRLEEGFVVNIKASTKYEVKEIANVEEKYLDKNRIDLAKWMSRRCFCNISDCLKLMIPPGTTTKASENRVKEKSINFISLKKDEDEIEFDIETGKLKSDKQIRTLKFLLENGDALVSDIEMFADSSRAVVNTLCKNGYTEIIEKKIERDPFEFKDIQKTKKLKLTDEQQSAYDAICDSMDDMLFSEFLIYGVTGSRKNRNLLTIN